MSTKTRTQHEEKSKNVPNPGKSSDSELIQCPFPSHTFQRNVEFKQDTAMACWNDGERNVGNRGKESGQQCLTNPQIADSEFARAKTGKFESLESHQENHNSCSTTLGL